MFLFEIWFHPFALLPLGRFLSSSSSSIYLSSISTSAIAPKPPNPPNSITTTHTHTDETKQNKTQNISKYACYTHIMRDWKEIKNKWMKKALVFLFIRTHRRGAQLWLFPFIHSIHTFKRAENSYNHQIIIVRFISL